MKCNNKRCSLLVILLLGYSSCAFGAPSVDTSDVYDDDDRVRSTIVTNSTTFPVNYDSTGPVFTKVLNMSDSGTEELLASFNLSKADILRKEREQHTNPHTIIHNDSSDDENDGYSVNKTYMINTYLGNIKTALNRTTQIPVMDDTYHNIAFYPVCSKNNATTWTAENTAKLYFSSTMFNKIDPHINLESAILSLRQIGETRATASCSEPEELLHVSVSVMVRRFINGEYKMKKHICQSFSTPKFYSGWQRVDIRQVILHWQKAHRASANSNRSVITDPMLAIDVLDQDSNPLKAGTFFEPTDCQASTASPWSFAERDDVRDIYPAFSVPSCPRLDIRYGRSQSHSLAIQNAMQRVLNPLEQLRRNKLQPSVFGQQSEQQNHQYMSPTGRDSTLADFESSPMSARHNRRQRARTHAQHRYHSTETTN